MVFVFAKQAAVSPAALMLRLSGMSGGQIFFAYGLVNYLLHTELINSPSFGLGLAYIVGCRGASQLGGSLLGIPPRV